MKVNIDSGTQYALARALAGHMFANCDGVLKVAGGAGQEKAYDPRSWGREAEAATATRVAAAGERLGSAGRSVLR